MSSSVVMLLLVVQAVVFASGGGPSPSLHTGDVRPRHHSVSGFSAGASAAMSHLIAYSGSVDGMGIVGGSPYACNKLPDAGNTCSGWKKGVHEENKTIPWPAFITDTVVLLEDREKQGLIDPISNMVGKKILLFSGLNDVLVYQSVMQAVADQLQRIKAKVKHEFTTPAGHAWVVDSETCSNVGVPAPQTNGCCGEKGSSTCPIPPRHATPKGGCCGVCAAGSTGDRTHKNPIAEWHPSVNNCEYDLVGEMLVWIYGAGAVKERVPQDTVTADGLIKFSQATYIPKGYTPRSALLDTEGYLYVPQGCKTSAAAAKCKVHVHYHGCGGSYRDMGYGYMLGNGLAAYAEANHMIIVCVELAH